MYTLDHHSLRDLSRETLLTYYFKIRAMLEDRIFSQKVKHSMEKFFIKFFIEKLTERPARGYKKFQNLEKSEFEKKI